MGRTRAGHTFSLRLICAAFLLACTLLTASSLWWSLRLYQQENLQILLHTARNTATQAALYRNWNTALGGVYAPLSDLVAPDPRLSHLPERDLTTPSGVLLTLVNVPAMFQQINALNAGPSCSTVRIVSLRPMQPELTPDAWEKTALETLRDGSQGEFSQLLRTDNGETFRYLLPLEADRGCIKTRMKENVKLGDMVAGISVLLPAASLAGASGLHRTLLWSVHGAVWLLGTLGIVAAFYALNRQFSARRSAESERQLLLDSAGEGIFAVDTDGNHTFVNPVAAQMLGYPVEELLGRNSHALVHATRPDGTHYPDTQCPIYAAFKEGEVFRGEDEFFQRRDGSFFPIQYTSRPLLRDDQVIGAVVTFMDVTEKKQAEQELRASRARLQATFRQAAVGMALLDLEGRWLEVNDRFCAMTGFSRQELLSRKVSDLTHPDDLPAYEELNREFLSGLRDTSQREKRYLHRDGRVVFANVSRALIRDQAGAPAYFVSVIEDITGRKAAEEQRRELEVQLVQAQKMETVGRLAGGVAHDFNNLLTVITCSAGFALEQIPPGSELHNDLLEVKNAGERAANLTRQLLAFSRKQEMELRPVALPGLVNDMAKMLRRLVGENIAMDTGGISAGLPTVWADPGMLEQVLMNLVVNARDAMPQGGTIHIGAEPFTITEEFCHTHHGAQPGHYVRLTVADTGSGIPANIQEKIFEPFFTTKKRGEGTGLGLATVYGIVKQHGGYIAVSSRPGEGAAFDVFLPTTAASGDGPETEDATLPGEHETILLVEDDEPVRLLLARQLEAYGYTLLASGNVADALALSRTSAGSIDLLFTDILLPDGNGYDLADQLANERPGLKILFMSGYPGEARSEKFKDETFLSKPFSLPQLSRKLRALLAPPRS